ncbi:hypothetical protein [Coralliovum pocilloporae]|uniref:hypothetical protein n=1 Tax=Coralliovum pocilloporae TaxID=3066369 RepID=UPI0033070091
MSKTRFQIFLSTLFDLFSQGRMILLGSYLIVLYLFCILAVVLTLAAHQMQHKAQSLQINGEAVSISMVKDIALYLDKLSDREDRNRAYRDDVQQANDSLKALQEVKLKESEAVSALKIQIRKKVYEAVSPEAMAGIRERYPTTYSTMESFVNYAIEIADSTAQLDVGKLTELRLSYEAAVTRRNAVQDRIDVQIRQISAIEAGKPDLENEKSLQSQITDVREYVQKVTGYTFKVSGEVKDGENKEFVKLHKIASEFQSLKSIEKSYIPIFKLVSLQPEILILILVMVMGMLGGLIHLTQGFLYGERNESPSYYIFRPILGVSAAVTIYILAKAGVLVVADPSTASGSGNSLSPFFVSFLAIVSGLMAQNALGNVHRAGENLFKPANLAGKGRWAFGVEAALARSEAAGGERTRKNLIALLGESEGVVNDWIRGTTETPEHAQKAIAAWVNQPVHLLFHDLKTSDQPEEKAMPENKPEAGKAVPAPSDDEN